jgi:hypothetical protein
MSSARPASSALTLETGIVEPATAQRESSRRRRNTRQFEAPERELSPPTSITLPGIGNNRGPPPGVFEEGDKPLLGGRAIWAFRNKLLNDDLSLSAVFKQLNKGEIPANRTAGKWISSERKLRLH